VDKRAAFGVVFGLADDLASDRCDLALAEKEVTQQVDQGVAFGPAEEGA
jgi:hypothetical protein